jgi:hypothetical protein
LIHKPVRFISCISQDAAKARRENKELARLKELKNKEEMEPTQGAAMAKKQETTRVLNSHKNAMKKAVAASKGGAKKCGTVKNTKKMEAVLETMKLPKAPRKPPVLQGHRRIPTPGDGHGCRHRGLRELYPCTKVWIGAYIKVGAWLHKKPCFDCANRGEAEGTRERVLDASIIL